MEGKEYPPGPDLDLQVATKFFRRKLKPIDWCPAYSTDMKWTSEILTKLQQRNQTIALRWWPEHEVPGHPGGLWSCHLGMGSHDVSGETLEHAVALAALTCVDSS
jgi:hypothetical protein